jgi:hypothetical protein
VGQQPHEVESEQRSAYKVVVLGQEMDLDISTTKSETQFKLR